ncbi:MAG: DUF6268 family outer membrane beta-barrel protein [Candidatus Omnitrophica bacterium]|nr:DUF6268 family outer membrane beta-barrel protein [Candidatus Omnitrophota bacterium]
MRIIKCGVILVILFWCHSASAEGVIDSYLRYMPARDASAQAGKVEIIEAESQYDYEFKVRDKLPVKFSLSNNYVGIENTTVVKLPAHLVGLSADAETTFPFFTFENTYLRLGVTPSFYGQDWDFPASAFRIPSRAFLIYRPNEKWTFLGGVAFYPNFENEVLPILGFIYKPNQKLTFEIVPKRPNISYALNEKATLFTEAGTSFGEYEVDKDGLKNVVLRYRQTHLGSGVKYKFNRFIEASFSGGAVFGRSLKYRDDALGKVNIKDAGYAEFRLEVRI